MKTAGEVLIDNGLAFQAAKWYDQLIGAMEEYANLYSAGEEVYDVAISELDTNAVNWRGATVVLAEHFERVAENISDRITHQPVSEEDIVDMVDDLCVSSFDSVIPKEKIIKTYHKLLNR